MKMSGVHIIALTPHDKMIIFSSNLRACIMTRNGPSVHTGGALCLYTVDNEIAVYSTYLRKTELDRERKEERDNGDGGGFTMFNNTYPLSLIRTEKQLSLQCNHESLLSYHITVFIDSTCRPLIQTISIIPRQTVEEEHACQY